MTEQEQLAACHLSGQMSATQSVAHQQARELVEHHCPREGHLSIKAGQPCNWCGVVEQQVSAPGWFGPTRFTGAASSSTGLAAAAAFALQELAAQGQAAGEYRSCLTPMSGRALFSKMTEIDPGWNSCGRGREAAVILAMHVLVDATGQAVGEPKAELSDAEIDDIRADHDLDHGDAQWGKSRAFARKVIAADRAKRGQNPDLLDAARRALAVLEWFGINPAAADLRAAIEREAGNAETS
ncbi:MAG: hypothetical protein ACRECD_13930 [Burkholderiaceae bacterium]